MFRKGQQHNMRMWRNWQTRTFEGRVISIVWVQVPSSAPNKGFQGHLESFVFFPFFQRDLNPKRAKSKKCKAYQLHHNVTPHTSQIPPQSLHHPQKNRGRPKVVSNKAVQRKRDTHDFDHVCPVSLIAGFGESTLQQDTVRVK